MVCEPVRSPLGVCVVPRQASMLRDSCAGGIFYGFRRHTRQHAPTWHVLQDRMLHQMVCTAGNRRRPSRDAWRCGCGKQHCCATPSRTGANASGGCGV